MTIGTQCGALKGRSYDSQVGLVDNPTAQVFIEKTKMLAASDR